MGDIKAKNTERDKRIIFVQRKILDDISNNDIVSEIMSEWNIGERMARKYIKWGHDSFMEKEEFTLSIKKAYYIKRKLKLIRDMDPAVKKTATGVRAINDILDSMAKIEGVLVNKHEISGKDGNPITLENTQKTIFILPDNGRDLNTNEATQSR